jgi:primosomal protein N' (replication factor Y)
MMFSVTKAKPRDREPAAGLPVARVCVDVPLPHLDRLFDYRVPSELDDAAQPGVRVKIRFSGKLTDGWLIGRVAESDHPKLSWLEKVVSPEPVLRPEIAELAREVAARYAGNLADVLRLAVPPRQAAVEKAPPAEPPPVPLAGPLPVDGAPLAADGGPEPGLAGGAQLVAVSPALGGSARPGGDAGPGGGGRSGGAGAGTADGEPGGEAGPGAVRPPRVMRLSAAALPEGAEPEAEGEPVSVWEAGLEAGAGWGRYPA